MGLSVLPPHHSRRVASISRLEDVKARGGKQKMRELLGISPIKMNIITDKLEQIAKSTSNLQ